MNYFPFHIGDYASDTAHLEPMEDLAYRRMLDLYYRRESALHADPAEVARLIRLRNCLEEVKAVLGEFFELSDDGWRHVRCDEEIKHMQKKQSKARESAAASVHARKAKADDQPRSERSTNAQRTLNKRSADVELPTPTPTPTPITTTNVVGESAPKPRPTRKCPETFMVTPAMQDWADQNTPLVNQNQATATFRDHTFKTGIADWAGAWRNWMRREQKFIEDRKPSAGRQTLSFAERDEKTRRKRWEEMTGRKWPEGGEVIDVAAVNSEIQEFLQ